MRFTYKCTQCTKEFETDIAVPVDFPCSLCDEGQLQIIEFDGLEFVRSPTWLVDM